MCSGLLTDPNACGTCLESACCDEMNACHDDLMGCWACITDPNVDPAVCSGAAVAALLDSVQTCADGCCSATCFDGGCNPVTNEGCDAAAGEACDFTGDGFGCFPAPNDTPACGECSNADGPFCEATLTCSSDADGNTGCTHYCCDDGDCGANGACDKANHTDGVGICLPK